MSEATTIILSTYNRENINSLLFVVWYAVLLASKQCCNNLHNVRKHVIYSIITSGARTKTCARYFMGKNDAHYDER